MTRSIWKGPFIDFFLLRKKYIKNKQNFKIWSRRSSIPEFFIGKTVQIYNGKVFKKILITREKIGYKFGDFSFTKNFSYKIKKKIKIKKKK
jgi:small subunit ribosomal protein S19